MKEKNYILICLIALLGTIVSGCDSNKATPITAETVSSDVGEMVSETLSKDTLAVVNGVAITGEEVQFSIEKNFDFTTQHSGGDALQESVLDSLIVAEVIKQRAKSKLSREVLERIKHQTAAYEHELYIKEYLSATVKPKPVTDEMVKTYYEQHPERFGGAEIKEFELLKSTKTDEVARDQFLSEAQKIKETHDWKALSKNWAETLGLRYQLSNAKAGVLVKELDSVIGQLEVGEASDPILINGVIHMLRVIDIRTIAPKPIVQFKTQIRESLAPIQLREAIKDISDQLLQEADIQRINKNG